MKENYLKYNNLIFEGFSMEKILTSMGTAKGFLLLSVFQKKYSVDINLKRHEDMKNWLRAKRFHYLVLDGIQKVYDDIDKKHYDYSMLYFLIFLNQDSEYEEDLASFVQIILKRYDLSQVILKDPFSETLESWNRDLVRKTFRNLENSTNHSLLERFFQGIHKKKGKFYFLGIEKPSDTNLAKKPYMNNSYSHRNDSYPRRAIA